MTHPKSVTQKTVSPSRMSRQYLSSRPGPLMRPAWVYTVPLGLPVVPEVYMIIETASEGSRAVSASVDFPATNASQVTSRPSCMGTASPERSSTTTFSTFVPRSSAASTVPFRGTFLPRRTAPSTVKRMRASACINRSARPSGPKPEKTGSTATPVLKHAYMTMAASGTMGRNTPATSPGLRPISRMAFARRETSAESSA